MYSVEYVISTKTKEQLDSDRILSSLNLSAERKSDMRIEVLQGIRDSKPLFLCGYCKKPVYLCGGKHTGEKGKSFKEIYFKHYSHSPECKFYLKTKYGKSEIERMKFHGLKEGHLHQMIKNEIAQALNVEGYDAEMEKVVSVLTLYKDGTDSDNYKRLWRRPDVHVKNKEKQFVVEIQLATTFLSVILDRMNFYKESKHHVLWVLSCFKPKEEQKFTTMDILSLTTRNIFEFNDEMISESKKQGKLLLRCHFEIPLLQDDLTFTYVWDNKIVSIDDLVFDNKCFIAYSYDCWAKEKELLDEHNKIIRNIGVIEESTYAQKVDYYEPHDSEEAFQIILKKEIDNIIYSGNTDVLDIFSSLYEKDFNCVEYLIKQAKKYNIKLPQLSHEFLKQLILVANDFSEYREVAGRILCHIDLDYEIEKVFNNDTCIFQIALNLENTAFGLRSYLELFTRHGYIIPNYLIERCQKNLIEFKKATGSGALSEEERCQIEKSLIVTMWDKLQKQNLPNYFKLLEVDHTFRFIIRLASYSLGKPLGCAHPNLAALTGTMKESHAHFAHLTVEMIEACKLDKDIKISRNYMNLQKIAQADQDFSCDDLVYTLFRVFNK